MGDQKYRITIDRLFAPAPHDLITDPTISAPAFRLWCCLHMMAWLREPPDVDRMAERMDRNEPPNRRSIYRWLGELEASGWLDWQRSPGRAGVNDRFHLKTNGAAEPVTPESQPAQPVTPESQPVTPESQPVTPESQPPTFYPLWERTKHATQNHENHETHGGGGARAQKIPTPSETPAHVVYLAEQGMGAAAEFAHLDPESCIADYDARRKDGAGNGAIVDQWRITPPRPGRIYQSRSEADHGQLDKSRRSKDRPVGAGPVERGPRRKIDPSSW
jgi:hypothetical protein